MSSICNSLFEALFPGSSYPTRFSALTILGSIAEVFPVPEGKFTIIFGESIFFPCKTHTFSAFCFTWSSSFVDFLGSYGRFSLCNFYLDIIKFVNKGKKLFQLSLLASPKLQFSWTVLIMRRVAALILPQFIYCCFNTVCPICSLSLKIKKFLLCITFLTESLWLRCGFPLHAMLFPKSQSGFRKTIWGYHFQAFWFNDALCVEYSKRPNLSSLWGFFFSRFNKEWFFLSPYVSLHVF